MSSQKSGRISLPEAILRTVAYADVFDYPLTASEIHRYLVGKSASQEAVQGALDSLAPGRLTRLGDYYSLPGREPLFEVRLHRQAFARRLWRRAQRHAARLARLPYIHMLAVTGAMAVGNVEPGADIDFLIVTAPGRLWLCRLMVLAVARLASLQGVELCPNYLVTRRALAFPDRDLYSAHELAHMVPVFGMQTYDQMRRVNGWSARFLPNAAGPPPLPAGWQVKGPPGFSRPALERLVGYLPLDWLERWEMQRKIRKLGRGQQGNPEASFGPDWCKGHIHRHSWRARTAYSARLELLALEKSNL